MPEYTAREKKLIDVHRAIRELADKDLVNETDVGDVLAAYDSIFDATKIPYEDRRAVLFGFVAGIAAIQKVQQEQYEPWEQPEYPSNVPSPQEEDDQHFVGGPTGGVEERQGKDPRYVVQSGVHEGQNDSKVE